MTVLDFCVNLLLIFFNILFTLLIGICYLLHGIYYDKFCGIFFITLSIVFLFLLLYERKKLIKRFWKEK